MARLELAHQDNTDVEQNDGKTSNGTPRDGEPPKEDVIDCEPSKDHVFGEFESSATVKEQIQSKTDDIDMEPGALMLVCRTIYVLIVLIGFGLFAAKFFFFNSP